MKILSTEMKKDYLYPMGICPLKASWIMYASLEQERYKEATTFIDAHQQVWQMQNSLSIPLLREQ